MDSPVLQSMTWTDRVKEALAHPGKSVWAPSVSASGRLSLPGLPRELSIGDYRLLAETFGRILHADQLLQSFRDDLSLYPAVACPEALTPLSVSRKTANLFYKREDQTITQAYKVRGAVTCMFMVMETQGCNRFLAVSTGNHALGVLKAAEILQPDSVRIVVPTSTAQGKLAKLYRKAEQLQAQRLHTQIVFGGDTFDEAREWAMAQNEAEFYISPYDDPWVVAGQGTLGMEVIRQLTPRLEAARVDQLCPSELVVSAPIGGGGLMAGTATALRMAMAWHPAFRGLALKLVGLRLADLYSPLGDAIRVKKPGSTNTRLFHLLGVDIRTMSDPQMQAGMDAVHADLQARIEGASGGSLLPLTEDPACTPSPERWSVAVLSGGNVAGH